MGQSGIKTKSLSLNYILYNLRMVLDILLPLFLFPYVTRIIGPEKLGKIGFAESIIGYFILFSQLGIHSYAVREFARVRDNIVERSNVFWELSICLLSTTTFASLIYFITIFSVPRLSNDILLYFVIFPNLFFSNFNYEWVYTAVEDQTFITRRYLIVKIIQFVLIFSLIKKAEDYILYAAISLGLNSFSSLFNIFHLKNYISSVNIHNLNIKKHVRYCFLIFASILGLSINRYLDVTMIGVMIDDSAVSYYNVANKIIMIARNLIIGITTVLNPRIENLFKKKEFNTYKHYLNISLNFILITGIPSVVGIIFLAPEIIYTIAGVQYEQSILSMQLLSPIIILVGLINIIVALILYPNRRESAWTITVFISAFINTLFNFLMIPRIGHNGAILGTVIAELISLTISILFAKEYLKKGILKLSIIELLKYILGSCVVIGIVISCKYFIKNQIITLICSIVISIPIYFFVLYLFKSKYILDLKKIVLENFLHTNKGNNDEKNNNL